MYSGYWAPEPSLGDTVTVPMTIEQFAEAGTWSNVQIYLQDVTGNSVWLDSTELANMGYQTNLEVISEQDISPPTLTYFDFSPDSVNVVDSSAVVDVTIGFEDDISGLEYLNIYFYSPSGGQYVYSGYWPPEPSLGDTVTVPMTIDQYSEAGIWTINQMSLRDIVGNYRWYNTEEIDSLGFPTELYVESFQDTTPPQLTYFSFSPDTVNVSDTSAVVEVTLGWEDDMAGLQQTYLYLFSPSSRPSFHGTCPDQLRQIVFPVC